MNYTLLAFVVSSICSFLLFIIAFFQFRLSQKQNKETKKEHKEDKLDMAKRRLAELLIARKNYDGVMPTMGDAKDIEIIDQLIKGAKNEILELKKYFVSK